MTMTVDEIVVRKSVRVQIPVERAVSIFVERMETWWPATHQVGGAPFVRIHLTRTRQILIDPPVRWSPETVR